MQFYLTLESRFGLFAEFQIYNQSAKHCRYDKVAADLGNHCFQNRIYPDLVW